MILINLLPHREEKRKRRKQAFFVGLGAAAGVGRDGWRDFTYGMRHALSKTTFQIELHGQVERCVECHLDSHPATLGMDTSLISADTRVDDALHLFGQPRLDAGSTR